MIALTRAVLYHEPFGKNCRISTARNVFIFLREHYTLALGFLGMKKCPERIRLQDYSRAFGIRTIANVPRYQWLSDLPTL